MNHWTWMRITLVVVSFISAFFMPLAPAASPPVEWSVLLVMLILIPFSLLFVIWLQFINPRSAPLWRYPEWNVNPFKFSEPLQFFHLGAFLLLAGGTGDLIKLAITRAPIFPEALVGPIVGAGVLLGIKLCTIVFRNKMSNGI
jgi:FtsH-binding integral membrane protein